jgi:hypothetical protein
MQVDIWISYFWCFPSNMFTIEHVNVLLAMNSCTMNRIYFSQFNFALFRSFWYIFPHTHGCYAFSDQIEKQNHFQPASTLNWAKLGTFQACEILSFFAVVVQLECRTQNMDQINRGNSFSQFFLLLKSKGKRTPSYPNGLYCTHAQGCHVTHSSGRRTTGLKVAPNFTSGCGIG